jgi:ATP-binding cassette subfamily B protein
MAAITYVSQILNAVMRMTMIFQSVSRGVASGRRINEILECEPAIANGSFEEPLEKEQQGKIEFRDVSFSYPGMGSPKVLSHINLTIHPGETLAIMGATGCGKTSLVHLIPRFYDVSEGQVLLDDVDVREYHLKTLRDKVAIALQKSEIFQGNIRENIAWGDARAGEQELLHAAETAQDMEFIANKPEGMDTEVSQGGHSLSGGQKQRLAISRAVLKRAEVLILDDATSALDLKTEAALYDALNRDYAPVTKIIVAQRIASVQNADRIVILENGTIAAIGTHEELLKSSSIYQDIVRSQQRGGGTVGSE